MPRRARRLLPVLLACLPGACADGLPDAQHVAGGDPRDGRRLILRIGCGVCHTVPGVPGAHGRVGPSLEGFGERALIGGVLPNRPENLARWVRDAPSIAPLTGMPRMPLNEEEARHVAAYLYTLRGR